jgi:hypothetical protein
VSDDAREILSSDLTQQRPKIEDTSWIKPVKYVGVWWKWSQEKALGLTNDFPAVQLGITDYSKAKPNGTHAANTAHVKNISILQHNMALTV